MAPKQATHKLTTPCLSPSAQNAEDNSDISLILQHSSISFYPTWGHLYIRLFKNKLYNLSQVFPSHTITKVHIIKSTDLFLFLVYLLTLKLLFPSAIILIQLQ